jgi:hypothetical protein
VLLVLGGTAWAGVHLAAHRVASTAGPSGHGHEGATSHSAYLTTSLSLCLSLALVLAATSSVYPRWKGRSGSSLWLFGAVPLLGLLSGALLDSGGTLAGAGANVVELLPFAFLVLVIQVAVAFTAVKAARGLLDVVEATVRALVGPPPARRSAGRQSFALARVERIPAARIVVGGSPRAPPSSL